LHTKSAAETLDRIANMWVKPYITAAALDTIVAQRLVRKICPHCKCEVEKTSNETMVISAMMKDIGLKSLKWDNVKIYRWAGCDKCNHTWYAWRIWVYEIIRLNEKLKNLIKEWASSEEIITEAKENDMISIAQDWILKAIKWYTTIEEVLRVV
jgi:type IV pilus assembly protein PilB